MKKRILSLLLAMAMTIGLIPAIPASANTNTNSITITANNNYTWKTGTHDGYDYELWSHSTGTGSMTVGKNGTFTAEWKDAYSILFRTGRKFLNAQRTHTQIGTISIDYDAQFSRTGTWLSVYGWANTKELEIEYYIVDDWATNRPYTWGFKPKATVNIDGDTYEIYEFKNIELYGQMTDPNFRQYWSIRTERRRSGTISVSEHFKAWEKAGMELGILHEVALKIESYNSSGTASVTKNNLTINGELNPPNPPIPPPAVNAAGDIRYNFNNFRYFFSPGSNFSIANNGSGTVNFMGQLQYRETKFDLPHDLSLQNCPTIVVNMSSPRGRTAIKFYNNKGEEAFVIWNTQTANAQNITFNLNAEQRRTTIRTIGIMSQDSGSYSATVNSITFSKAAEQGNNWLKENTPAATQLAIPANLRTQRVTADKGVASAQFSIAQIPQSNQRTVAFNAAHAGRTVKLYLYIPERQGFAFVCEVKIQSDGKANLTNIKWRGNYLAVII